MKSLLLFLLLVGGVCLYFHDKQQSADLAKALDDNASLTQQLADKQSTINGLQLKVQQLTAQIAQQGSGIPSRLSQPAGPGAPAGQGPTGLQGGSDDLNRPAYTH